MQIYLYDIPSDHGGHCGNYCSEMLRHTV